MSYVHSWWESEHFGSNLCRLRCGLGCHIKLRSVLAPGVPHILLRRFVKERPVAPSPPIWAHRHGHSMHFLDNFHRCVRNDNSWCSAIRFSLRGYLLCGGLLQMLFHGQLPCPPERLDLLFRQRCLAPTHYFLSVPRVGIPSCHQRSHRVYNATTTTTTTTIKSSTSSKGPETLGELKSIGVTTLYGILKGCRACGKSVLKMTEEKVMDLGGNLRLKAL